MGTWGSHSESGCRSLQPGGRFRPPVPLVLRPAIGVDQPPPWLALDPGSLAAASTAHSWRNSLALSFAALAVLNEWVGHSGRLAAENFTLHLNSLPSATMTTWPAGTSHTPGQSTSQNSGALSNCWIDARSIWLRLSGCGDIAFSLLGRRTSIRISYVASAMLPIGNGQDKVKTWLSN